ncbi:sensor histidine kinase [Spongiactinospora sp. TRM90649]|uniref:sensor histidine kinase n=1 Tax=Spongiactinospora sp. TRM90649 TaxID=3031114 RepID=UPI0023F6C10B|nr:sensor histidine kinase [Spongiactinospora sp. TRM90649]MDF5753917.1 sensor histidine kinase [Spongiactinospora sp. TRM90649]
MASDTGGDADGRWWPPRGWRADVLISVVVAFLIFASSLPLAREPGDLWPLGATLVVIASGALLARRRWPVPAAAVALVASLIYYGMGLPVSTIIIAFVVMLYTLAEERGFWIAAGFTVAVIAGLALQEVQGADNGDVFRAAGWLVAVVAAGCVARQRRNRIAQAEQRARAEERLRIARDLHDALGHRLSLINVQASAALHRLAEHPERAEPALASIKEASREALGDLRATLGMLRVGDRGESSAPERGPASGQGLAVLGVAGLDALVAGARRTGLAVRLSVGTGGDGSPELPPEVDQAVYRIVQEALTNVTRHSGAGSAAVAIEFDDRSKQVTVRVDDDGGAAPGPPGHGIRGMRERAAALGGELAAGPRPGGGFEVCARLPVRVAR